MAVWTRVLLPQVLGEDLPSRSAQKPAASQPVPKLSPSGVDSALSYIDRAFALAREGSAKVGVQRIGPADGDARGLWALKASDTRLLRAAHDGITTQVSRAEQEALAQADRLSAAQTWAGSS